MMASDQTTLNLTDQEDKTSGQYRKRGSSNNSPGRLTKSTNNSQDSRCSLSSSQSGSIGFNYSYDFHDNASRAAANSNKNSFCSKENYCGTSQKNYYKDFHSDSSETSTSEECGSFTIPLLQPLESKQQILQEKEKGDDVCAKGGKTLPKKKLQQKNTFLPDINSQQKNNTVYHLLSERDQKIKELENKVAVLQKKLEAITMENKKLKHLQSQQLKEISTYKNAEMNLPELLATQSNEVQALRAQLRKSQEEERRASKKLRDVEAQLIKTRDDLQALQKMYEEKKLKESEELQHKLISLSQKLEASEKRMQDLEKQLSLSTASFRHQLAVEKKRAIVAQSNTANLQIEIKSLKLKLKERERELSVTNIYAHQMHKGQPEEAESSSSPKGPLLNPQITPSRRPRNRQQGEISDLRGDSVTNYKPSFAGFPKERPKDTSSTPSEEKSHKIPPGKKRLLLQKLFGPNNILNTK